MGIPNASKINKWKFPLSCIPSNALCSKKCSITDILLQDAGKVLGIERSEMKEIKFGPSILFHSNENTIKLSHPEKFPFNKQPRQFQSPLEHGCWNSAINREKKDDRYKLRVPLFLLMHLLIGCIPASGKGTTELFEWSHFPPQMGMNWNLSLLHRPVVAWSEHRTLSLTVLS